MIATLLGKKIGMTQVYDAQNVLVPVTVVEAGPCPVVQIKTVETDGYNAVQLGFGAQKAKNASKAEASHAKKAGLETTPRVLNEVRLTEAPSVKLGDIITVAIFSEGQIIDVLGVSKGKGFQGVVKIIAEKNLILVKGAIPGANGDDVIIRSGKKAKPAKA